MAHNIKMNEKEIKELWELSKKISSAKITGQNQYGESGRLPDAIVEFLKKEGFTIEVTHYCDKLYRTSISW